MNLSTEAAYEAYCKKAGVEVDTVELKEGGLGHWIGNKKAKNVLVYYHGNKHQQTPASPYPLSPLH